MYVIVQNANVLNVIRDGAASAYDERTVSAFRITRLLDLTFNVVSKDRHYHSHVSFCSCLVDVGVSPMSCLDSPRV